MTLKESAFEDVRIVRAAWSPDTPAPTIAIVFFDGVEETVILRLSTLTNFARSLPDNRVLISKEILIDKRMLEDSQLHTDWVSNDETLIS